jgi:hypothetical protein
MALLSLNRIAWTYSSDDGASYRVAAQKAVTDQGKSGGIAWAGVVGPLPFGYKMRRITVRNAAQNFSRVTPVYERTATLMTAGTTINLNHLSDSYAFTSDGGSTLIAENRPRHSVTKQST